MNSPNSPGSGTRGQGAHPRSAADLSAGAAIAPWWGPHAIPLDESRFWQIGPLRLWALHRLYQWQLSWEHGADWLAPDIHVNVARGAPEPSRQASRVRCAYRESVNEIAFHPALADRSLVTKFEDAIRVLPGEEMQLYVCAPLWLRIETMQPAKTMAELPIFRLSDTWFGPTGPAGELAYASRVPVYLQLRDVPLRLHCAITSVVVRNSGADSLTLDRVNIPMPRLSLFYSRRSGFWTDALTLERREGSELASMRSLQEPPPEAAPHQFIASPRTGPVEENAVVRAFSGLFK